MDILLWPAVIVVIILALVLGVFWLLGRFEPVDHNDPDDWEDDVW